MLSLCLRGNMLYSAGADAVIRSWHLEELRKGTRMNLLGHNDTVSCQSLRNTVARTTKGKEIVLTFSFIVIVGRSPPWERASVSCTVCHETGVCVRGVLRMELKNTQLRHVFQKLKDQPAVAFAPIFNKFLSVRRKLIRMKLLQWLFTRTTCSHRRCRK